MDTLQADRIVKAIVDGIEEYREIAARAGVDPLVLVDYDEVIGCTQFVAREKGATNVHFSWTNYRNCYKVSW